jgi:hypothetical protein
VVVFQDSFDTETGSGQGASGQSKVNYTAFAQWTVSDGSVDLIAQSDFGIDCFGGSGKCVDLDGGTNDAGVLTSVALNLAAGSYDFSFQLSGTDSGFINPKAAYDNIVDVSIGGLFATTITANQGDRSRRTSVRSTCSRRPPSRSSSPSKAATTSARCSTR